jgi:hypothetical protein
MSFNAHYATPLAPEIDIPTADKPPRHAVLMADDKNIRQLLPLKKT